MKRVPHPSGVSITFDSKWHQYRIGNTALRSVSKLLDKHFPFDEERILGIVSKKTGQTVEEVKKSWNRQALLGKNIHEYIENKLQGLPPPTWTLLMKKQQEREAEKKSTAKKRIKKSKKTEQDSPSESPSSSSSSSSFSATLDAMLHGEEAAYLTVADHAVDVVKEHYDIVAVEQIVASPSWGMAGTIDFIGRNKKTKKILIGDWKTSGSTTSPFRFGSFEAPCSGCLMHIPNNKFYRYAMQIIAYGEILKREKYLESGFFGKTVKPLESAAVTEIVIDPRKMHDIFEYGIVQMSKNEEGGVCVEFKKVTEKTVLPVDAPEVVFMEQLRNVMRG